MMLTAEIGYGIFSEYRGKSIGLHAVAKLCVDAFQQSPLRKLIAFVHEDNVASRKILEKIGFSNEGLLKDHYIINGEPVNEVIYGLLSKNFIQA